MLAAGMAAAVLAGLGPRPGGTVLADESLTGGTALAGESLTGTAAHAGESLTGTAPLADGLTEDMAEDLEEGITDDMSESDLDQLIDEYFSRIESGDIGAETGADAVVDPPLGLTEEEDGRIRYTFPNGNYFITTTPKGMITSQPVDVFLSSGIVGVLKKDDVLDLMPDSWHFAAPGNYHIKMLSYQPASDVSDNYNVYEVNYYFTIINSADGRLGAIPAPEDFRITEVRLNGRPLPVEEERCFFLTEDGQYEICYADQQGGNILGKTVFVHDTTAPFLSFSRELEGRETEAPLEFYPSEPDCRVTLSYNGDRGYAVSNVLTAAGSYELCVEDAAGNKRSYYLRIRQTYDLMDMRILLAGGAVLIGLAVWLVFLRRNMKVI